ncbi:caspase family protein [Geovibrio ferrireducens]|uniref:caspase family protein n=1 Tax=Geovibrio ferrireducens TaxID=46201 RepID=UPI00224815CB|nr:caspase family protein [Geovibrio ferrireducens]
MPRKAIIIGNDYYTHAPCLHGCVNDAISMASLLERNADGTRNFDVRLEISNNCDNHLTKVYLQSCIDDVFAGEPSVALFYFSGHAAKTQVGGFLSSSEIKSGDDGVPMTYLLHSASNSKARNKIIILDCCYAGIAGETPFIDGSILPTGITILAAATREQYSMEKHGSGVFTKLFVDALSGSAANLFGEITMGSVYAHIDKSLGAWDQRPVFKTNVSEFVWLRKSVANVSHDDLRRMYQLFSDKSLMIELDPDFEPTKNQAIFKGPDEGNKNKEEIFKLLQKLNRLNLIVPEGADHMYFAAMESKSCRLTTLGEFYWDLVDKKLI